MLSSPPPIVRYAVIRDADKWRINFEGMNYGFYDDAGAATAAAIATAHQAGIAGHSAQVVVEMLPMQFRIAWTHGVDPPPAAD